MKRFAGILICTDLDGTLLSSARTVSNDENAIAKMIEELETGEWVL